jgi:hypothetical protein
MAAHSKRTPTDGGGVALLIAIPILLLVCEGNHFNAYAPA